MIRFPWQGFRGRYTITQNLANHSKNVPESLETHLHLPMDNCGTLNNEAIITGSLI